MRQTLVYIQNKLVVPVLLISLLLLACGCRMTKKMNDIAATGMWDAHLVSPGGELSFGLEIERNGASWSATIINGEERIFIPSTTLAGSSIVFDMPHYDSKIVATIESASHLKGEWTKRRGEDDWTHMPFVANYRKHDQQIPSHEVASDFEGRWRVQFSSSEDPSLGIFKVNPNQSVAGTFLTTTGDYRYLAGHIQNGRLKLSCFDGAHAFLFSAELGEDGKLRGDFWSRDAWHETWVATKQADFQLPDAFGQTKWMDQISLADLSFPDLEGNLVSLADPKFHGKARILQIFGSWCPNCHDAALYLAELDQKYGDKGLSILGLAFEITDDFERNALLVGRYVERHSTPYPVLIAGPADKVKATEAFKALDKVRSYPTTVFLHADGRIRAIHTGFTGPATGEQYDRLRESFESIVEELLAE